ncbi:MAG: hypothetical protein ACK5XX_05850 [Holosporales bacterium]
MRAFLSKAAQWAKNNRFVAHALRYHPLYYPAAAAVFKSIAAADGADKKARIETLLRRTLARARTTDYGRGKPLDISAWPILEKDLIHSAPQRFITASWPRLPASTSGSSGFPLKLVRSVSNYGAEQAAHDYLFLAAGCIFRTSRVAILRGDNIKNPSDVTPPFWSARDKQTLVFSFPHLTPSTSLLFLKKLEEFNPDILWVYPTSGDALARYLLESGKTLPGVKVLFSSSEMLAPNSWPRWQQAFPQAIVLDYYSQAERVCLSYQRTADTAWFVPAYGYVELLPDAITLETPENLRSARVIATGFWNPAMPLVRYETGDRILYPRSYTDADLEAVALGDKPFTRVLGRLSEYLITPQGGQIQAINNIPYEVEHLERVQFIQSSPSSVEIRCAVLPGFSALDAEKLLVNARKKIPATIDVRIVTDKPLEKMTNGKTPFVIRQC